MTAPNCAHVCQFPEKTHKKYPAWFDHIFVPPVSPLRAPSPDAPRTPEWDGQPHVPTPTDICTTCGNGLVHIIPSRDVAPSPDAPIDPLGVEVDGFTRHAPFPDAPMTIDEQVEELERIVHTEGRCKVCGGGRPYWKHTDPLADEFHLFVAAQSEDAR